MNDDGVDVEVGRVLKRVVRWVGGGGRGGGRGGGGWGWEFGDDG